MPLLHIALQDGFSGDPVAIHLNGREIYHKDHVKTRTQIGFADSVEQTLPPGSVSITVQAGGATATIPVDLQQNLYLALSLTPDKRLTHRVSADAFGYA